MPASPTNFKQFVETTPGLVPTVAADVVAQDAWLDVLTFTNTTTSAITVTVDDKQGTARSVLKDFDVPAKDTVVIALNRRYCPSGINWVASATGLVGYVRYGVTS